jgi:hypothetical protein
MSMSEPAIFVLTEFGQKALLQQADPHPNDEGKECRLFARFLLARSESVAEVAKE